MHLHVTTILFVVFDQINKIFTQGMPISPCPKMFQYRFDGLEWFGILSVRNPDYGQALHVRVTLSMRGKPTTNYLGEIELLTRGQFLSDTPVLYRVKFPKHHFPPKLLQITTNNQIICLGAVDHGIFVTHIQLEHTRKFTFIPDDISKAPSLNLPSTSSSSSSSPSLSGPGAIQSGGSSFVLDSSSLPTNIGFGTKHLPLAGTDNNPMRTTKDICGTIDDRIRFQVLHSMKVGMPSDEIFAGGDELLPRADGFNVGASNVPLVTADDDSNAQSSQFASDSSMTNDELPSITRGAWPWLAAIYVNNLTSLAYQCGGTLVSARIVISSAHCFEMFKKRYTANEVLVFLGRHNLKNWNEEGSLAAPCDDIYIHPDYDNQLNTYDADIAVIVLKNEVRFNTFIRPACMWSGSTKSEYIEGERGIIVGWGLSGNGNGSSASAFSTAVPRIVDAPIVSNDVCFKANEKFRSISSNRTFCAGVVMPTIVTTKSHAAKASTKSATSRYRKTPTVDASQRKKPTGLCTGDSGAGLMLFKNNRWMLRGTVSASLPISTTKDEAKVTKSNSGTGRKLIEMSNCNGNQYVIYTDVAKFLDWIFAFII